MWDIAQAQQDTLLVVDEIPIVQDSVIVDSLQIEQPTGDIKTTVVYQAKDSIYFDVIKQVIFLYGDAKITYGQTELQAAEIQFSWLDNTLRANGVTDSCI